MANVWVSVELDEVSTWELIDELENRYLGEREQCQILELVKNNNAKKLAFFIAIQDKFSLLELQQKLVEAFPNQPTPIEQLSLFNNQKEKELQ